MIIVSPIDNVDSKSYKNFSCGISELDTYLLQFAKQNHKKGISKTFVGMDGERAIGFYTISMASIEFRELPIYLSKGIPKYPLPVAKLGKLAVDGQFQGKKLGAALLFDSFKKIQEASAIVAAFGIVVDAKNESAKKFYENYGFISYKNELSLFLPMKTVNLLFNS